MALDNAERTLKEDSPIVQNLKKALSLLEPVATDLMKKKDEEFDKVIAQTTKIREENDIKYTTWSMYEVDLYDESSIPTNSSITYGTVKEVKTKGSTWMDVWMATEELAKEVDGFGDHIFIEGYEKVEENKYRVVLGS
jgi:hypothetical protein